MSTSFYDLHHAGAILVLPNAWDAASARLVEECGARAVATSSAALAWAHGHADGERFGGDGLLGAVREIARVIRVPLSVDFEGGYCAGADGIAETLRPLLAAGAAGINLEDGTAAPELLAEKIAGARRLSGDLFINARTDIYLRSLFQGEAALAETLRRARLYADAGADGLFVPGLVDGDDIRAVAAATPLPLNLLARPTLPPVSELQRLGVRRLSVGCALAQAALATVRRATRELLDRGSYDFLGDLIPVAELNGWFRL